MGMVQPHWSAVDRQATVNRITPMIMSTVSGANVRSCTSAVYSKWM